MKVAQASLASKRSAGGRKVLFSLSWLLVLGEQWLSEVAAGQLIQVKTRGRPSLRKEQLWGSGLGTEGWLHQGTAAGLSAAHLQEESI